MNEYDNECTKITVKIKVDINSLIKCNCSQYFYFIRFRIYLIFINLAVYLHFVLYFD